MKKNARIFLAGHKGLLGTALYKKLQSMGYRGVITRSHKELDLVRQKEVEEFFKRERPEFVFLTAGKVGGIQANQSYPADFIYQNIMIQSNVIHSAYTYGVKKLLFLGSSCIYPRECPQPMKEEYLLSGPLEKTNEPYAVAKISGIKMCQSFNRQFGTRFICAMPTNLYGPNDNFDLEHSHVIPGLIRKFHLARKEELQGKKTQVVLWGSGTPRREFLYVEDMADACIFLMDKYEGEEIINVGTGMDITIRELGEMLKKVVGFGGEIVFDSGRPDGTPQKLLDTSKINRLGWSPNLGLEAGLTETYRWYSQQYD